MTGSPPPGISLLHVLVPGPLEQETGGYRYDRRMVEELRALGDPVRVHELPGRFPGPDRRTGRGLDGVLRGLPTGSLVLIDGLAMGAYPGPIERHAGRLRILSLLHHPLADEAGLLPRLRGQLLRLERRALAAVCGVVVTSRFTANRVAGLLGVDPARIRVVEPGTDRPDHGSPAPSAPPRSSSGARRPLRLLSVGALTPRKAHDVLLAALDLVRDPGWECRIVGSPDRDPQWAEALRLDVERLGLGDRVRFDGEVGDSGLEEAYRWADLLVHPSRYEGYGMVIGEALTYGLPVITTTGGALPGTLPPGAGILVPPDDPDALAGALRELLEEPDRRGILAATADAAGQSLPGWPEQVRHFRTAIEELASHGG